MTRIGTCTALLALGAAPAAAVDWSAVKGKEMTLFHPGQSSWEWMLTPSDHEGAKKFRGGKACVECHEGEEQEMVAEILSGDEIHIEPEPLEGKPGTTPLTVKAAHDGERLYLRLEWPEAPGAVGRKMDPEVEAKATMMLGDGSVVSFRRGGCWGTCHADLEGMPHAPEGVELTKYLTDSRTKITRSGGGENYKSERELEELVNKGVFVEYWHAHVNRGAAPVPSDGWILDKRHENATPAVTAEGGLENGKWVVVFSRELRADAEHRKSIQPGKVYPVGFAVHIEHAADRYHNVSLPQTLALDEGDADIIAVKQ